MHGAHDDITGPGQTRAAHDLCVNIPEHRRTQWMQPGVGHFGVFNGSRFRAEVLPRVSAFIRAHD